MSRAVPKVRNPPGRYEKSASDRTKMDLKTLKLVFCGGQRGPKSSPGDPHERTEPAVNFEKGACRSLLFVVALLALPPLVLLPSPIGFIVVEYPAAFPEHFLQQYLYLAVEQFASLLAAAANLSTDATPWEVPLPESRSASFIVGLVQAFSYIAAISLVVRAGRKIDRNWRNTR